MKKKIIGREWSLDIDSFWKLLISYTVKEALDFGRTQ